MRLVCGMNATVINVKEDEFTNKDGQPVKTYKMAIEQNGEVATLPCTEEAFKEAKPMEKNNLFVVYSENQFNGKVTKFLRVTGVATAK